MNDLIGRAVPWWVLFIEGSPGAFIMVVSFLIALSLSGWLSLKHLGVVTFPLLFIVVCSLLNSSFLIVLGAVLSTGVMAWIAFQGFRQKKRSLSWGLCSLFTLSWLMFGMRSILGNFYSYFGVL